MKCRNYYKIYSNTIPAGFSKIVILFCVKAFRKSFYMQTFYMQGDPTGRLITPVDLVLTFSPSDWLLHFLMTHTRLTTLSCRNQFENLSKCSSNRKLPFHRSPRYTILSQTMLQSHVETKGAGFGRLNSFGSLPDTSPSNEVHALVARTTTKTVYLYRAIGLEIRSIGNR